MQQYLSDIFVKRGLHETLAGQICPPLKGILHDEHAYRHLCGRFHYIMHIISLEKDCAKNKQKTAYLGAMGKDSGGGGGALPPRGR
jgi:hypothetical protein